GTLGGGSKSGYNFACAGTPAVVGGDPSFFDTNADPASSGIFGTGNRWFYSNESFVIYQDSTGTIAAPGYPARVPATGTPIE
ncbi:MAG TPA: hypothetical protein VID27_14085, partial [Blastocatellia bacterium]